MEAHLVDEFAALLKRYEIAYKMSPVGELDGNAYVHPDFYDHPSDTAFVVEMKDVDRAREIAESHEALVSDEGPEPGQKRRGFWERLFG